MLAFLVFFAVFEGFEVAETIHDWSQDLDFLDIDDMILAAFLALASFAWFARRKLALRAAEHESDQYLLQTALDSMTDGIALFDKDERLVLWNEGFIRTSPALREIAARDITFTDLVARMSAKGRYLGVGADWVEKRVRQFRALESVENHMRDPDGRKRWAHVHLYRTRDGGTFLVRTDTTARKRVEAELNAVRRRLSEAIESIDEGIALFDKDERLELFNRRYAAEVAAIGDVFKPGLTFENMVRALARSGYYGAVDDKWIAERLHRFRALEEAEYAVSAVDGEPGWRTVRQFRTADGGTLIAVTDTTAQKRAAAELESSRYLLQDALDSMTDGVALFDKDERLVLWNDSFVDNRPYLRGFIRPGLTFAEIIEYLDARGGYGDGGPQMVNARLASFRGLEPAEMSVRDPDGGKRWFRINHYRTREGGTFLVRADITARKRAEMELESSRSLLNTALETMTDGVSLYDKDEQLVLWNEEFLRFPAMMRDIVKPGLAFVDLIEYLAARGGYVGKDRAWIDERIRKFRALEPIEVVFRDKDGSERWFNMTHRRTRDGGTLVVREDITNRMRALSEIERARAIAESANEAKTKFLASMSHEVRTPLNAILGFTQMMELGLGKLPEAQSREYLAIILKSGQHLLDLVNQILEFAKIESQGDQKTFVPLSSADLARQSVDMVREEASRRKVALIDHVANTNADIRFLGDPLWVRQILINLLVNAVKYNRPGGMVALSVARGADGVVRFAVADTGSGIPRERHGHVFQPFQRLGREAGQIEGAGIGLALARQLALRMGGNIGFESEPGKGSTFWVELPAVADKVERVA